MYMNFFFFFFFFFLRGADRDEGSCSTCPEGTVSHQTDYYETITLDDKSIFSTDCLSLSVDEDHCVCLPFLLSFLSFFLFILVGYFILFFFFLLFIYFILFLFFKNTLSWWVEEVGKLVIKVFRYIYLCVIIDILFVYVRNGDISVGIYNR
jgi:hypothetical protein